MGVRGRLHSCRTLPLTLTKDCDPRTLLSSTHAPLSDPSLILTLCSMSLNASIALLMPFISTGPLSAQTQCLLYSMELAIKHVNTRNPSVVPQLANLRPGFHMNYTLLDTQLSPTATVELLMDYLFQSRELAGDGVQRAVLGPLLSDTTKPAALLAGAEQVPIVSYRASAPELVQLLRLLNPTLTRFLTLTRTLILAPATLALS